MYWNDLLIQLQIRYSGLDTSDRFKRLDLLERFLKGTLYDELQTPFYNTANSYQDYVPLRQRKPAVNFNLAKILVDRSADMLFGDQHFPEVHVEKAEYRPTETILKTLIRESGMKNKWKHAAKIGSVGSVVIIFKFVEGKLYHEVINAKFCSPEFHPRIPGELSRIREEKLVKGDELQPFGYNTDPNKQYIYRRDFTTDGEIEYFPVEYTADIARDKPAAPRENPDRSFRHNFGFVPGVWVRNLESEDPIDGESTFEAICGINVEMDYQISQIGRVFHYAGDPMLLIQDAGFDEESKEDFIKQVGNTLILNQDGKAGFIEISAQAQETNIKWVDKLRSLALEIGRGNRVNPEKLNAAQSGKALAMLHKDIISLVSELRLAYGEDALLTYFRKILKALKTIEINYPELKGLKANPDAHIVLRWGDYFESTADDYQTQFTALKTGIEAGVISKDRATKWVADEFDIEDVQAERAQIETEKKAEMELIAKLDQAQQVSMKLKSNNI